jgi:hypothetical protein
MGLNMRPTANGKYNQGYYKLINPDKYIGDPSKIVFRSSYEKKFMYWADMNPLVLKWGSEVIAIPYIGPDKRSHRYFIDFYMEVDSGEPAFPRRVLVEVKPSNELNPPSKPKTITAKSLESYEYASKMYEKNMHKWFAAINYAKDRGMHFNFVTEKNLGIK